MVGSVQARGDLLGVVGERAGQQHLAAVQEEPAWFAVVGDRVQLGLIARLREVSAVLDE